jgi:DNA-directed RNA polymerase specialized sigma24 family protein
MGRQEKAERDAAFAAFVDQATPSLLRTAWLLTGSTDAAHELVQASLVKTYAAWHRVRADEALAYTRRVLVNHNTDMWRRRRGEHLVSDLPERSHHDSHGADHRDEVVRLLATLPAQQRRVVVLRYYSGSGDRTNLTAFHAEVMTDGEAPGPLLRSVTFTGRDGQRQSHSYSAGNKG